MVRGHPLNEAGPPKYRESNPTLPVKAVNEKFKTKNKKYNNLK